MIDVFSCALSWILLIAEIQKDGNWNLLLVMYLQCQAVVKNLSHLVLFCFFFPCLEGYKSVQMPKCFQICFCNNFQPCVIHSFVKKCADAELLYAASAFGVPGTVSPGLFGVEMLLWGAAGGFRGQKLTWIL